MVELSHNSSWDCVALEAAKRLTCEGDFQGTAQLQVRILDAIKSFSSSKRVVCDCGCFAFKRSVRRCTGCAAQMCEKHIFTRVDESNRRITLSAPELCRECYMETYST